MNPQGTQMFGSCPATCSVVDATDAVSEGAAEAVTCTRPELCVAWQSLAMMTPVVATCQVWVLSGEGECCSLWFRIPPVFPLWVEKRPRMQMIPILLCSRETTMDDIFPILSISNLTCDADMLFLHEVDTFMICLMMSLESVQHWFPF